MKMDLKQVAHTTGPCGQRVAGLLTKQGNAVLLHVMSHNMHV